jgi:hypothetical protein
MSTISRAHRVQLTIAATALVLALVGGIGSAFAQAAGGNGRGGGGGNEPDQSAVLVFGQPGNCPPTIACGSTPRHPPVIKARPVVNCGDRQMRAGGRTVCRPSYAD